MIAKNSNKKAGLAVMVLAFLFSTLPLYAQMPEDAPSQEARKDKKGRPEKLYSELGLTQEQKDQLKKLREEETAKAKLLREQVHAKKEELRKIFEDAKIDKAQAYALVEEIVSLEGQWMHLKVDNIIALKQILTPEQFQKMQEKTKKGRKEIGDRMKEGMKKRRGQNRE